MIVVDTNVIAYLLIAGEQTQMAREVMARDPEWAAPLFWRSEFRNLLATYMRRSKMRLSEAFRVMRAAEVLLAGREHVGDSRAILTLAEQSGQTAYDCEFVFVAQRLGVPLVTNDRQLARSFPDRAVTPEEFLSGR